MRYSYFLFKILAFTCLAMILLSCKKEILYEGPVGDLKGRAILSDRNVTLTDYSGVEVIIDGSTPELRTTTNEKGEYTIQGLKTGIYDIVFTKNGFGTYKIVSFQFLGGNISTYAGSVTLNKLPDFSITDLKVDTGRFSPYNYFVNVKVSLSVTTYYYMRYYISDSPDVSYSNYQATDYIYNLLSFNLLETFLSKLPKGKQLYIIFYPSASNSSYIDISNGSQIYDINSAKASKVVPFMIPNTKSYKK